MATVKNDSQGRIETVTLHRNEVLAIYDALDRGMSHWENDRDGDTTDDAGDDEKYDMATLVWRVLESVVAHPA